MDNFTAVCAFEAATFLIWSEPKREKFIADTLKKKKVKSEDNGKKGLWTGLKCWFTV